MSVMPVTDVASPLPAWYSCFGHAQNLQVVDIFQMAYIEYCGISTSSFILVWYPN